MNISDHKMPLIVLLHKANRVTLSLVAVNVHFRDVVPSSTHVDGPHYPVIAQYTIHPHFQQNGNAFNYLCCETHIYRMLCLPSVLHNVLVIGSLNL